MEANATQYRVGSEFVGRFVFEENEPSNEFIILLINVFTWIVKILLIYKSN